MDATSASIGISRDEFIGNLTASRLLADGDLEAFLAAHPDDDALALANALLSSGTLTDFQFGAIAQGRPNDVRIGNYDILNQLGAGGMGTVFKARHRRMKRIVALKVLATSVSKDPAFVGRFQREVETIARLGHPNIVMAYDADEAEVGHFLVMEFVEGQDLTSLVAKNHPIPVAQAMDCIVQAAHGLDFAHARGVVHRDIKPANLLRDKAGVVKVADLGLARLNSTDSEPAAGSGLTMAGDVLGTVDYMAPEQAVDSTTLDGRADIYSLGATLYFLLTGQPPYTGKTIMSILLKHREAPIPSIRDIRPDVPAELDEICRRMMAKGVAERFQTMGEVATALESLAGRLSPSAGGAVATTPPPTLGSNSSFAIASAKADTQTGQPQATALSVVILEPSRVQAGIIRRYLEAQGIVVAATVGTGALAAAAVREHRPGAIVSAFHLSDTTGVELAKQIRNEIRDNAPGFVLISSESDGQSADALSRLDRIILLPKPFSPEQLVQSLNLVTGRSIAYKETSDPIASRSLVQPGSSPLITKAKDRAALRVLIVDDSAAARVNERMVLTGLGFALFTEADDGATAIAAAAAAREPFDLIVTDYNMPLMNGYALVSYLRQNPSTAKVPIVMVTTETAPAVLDPVRKLDVVVFDKMFPAADVKPVIDRLFG